MIGDQVEVRRRSMARRKFGDSRWLGGSPTTCKIGVEVEELSPRQASDDSPSDSGDVYIESELKKVFTSEDEGVEIIIIMIIFEEEDNTNNNS
ncbi:hypothetical protein IEQ34_018211 [Dendrobium chrysotoxum]|uniref:Uncharacterized protein n=1 Tax=Dendrobium chrysotoxum TaxID=161865 RepID=A0AAV7GE85_DENCH|nr:hypothetical protein IEQ34_018211 [Dendrobium chrysotoxum]